MISDQSGVPVAEDALVLVRDYVCRKYLYWTPTRRRADRHNLRED
ncbi:hypothetical protein [Microtetraspora malaysiensis]